MRVKHSGYNPAESCYGGRGRGGEDIHTDTTGGHIGSHHHGALAGLELVEDPVTLVLLLVTVNGCKLG